GRELDCSQVRRWRNLIGEDSAIRKVPLAYKVYFARSSPAEGDDYTVDHTGFIYLVGTDGRYLGFLPPGTAPEQIAGAIRAHLKRPEAAGVIRPDRSTGARE